MKNAVFVLLLFYAFFCGCKCKEDKDTTAPFITIISPYDNQSFTVGESIPVKLQMSGDETIDYIQISVLDENQTQAIAAIVYNTVGKAQSLEMDFPINNTNLKSGKYYLAVKVSDGINEQTYFQKINISEIPLQRTAVYFIGNSLGQNKVYKIDSAYNTTYAYSLNGDFLGSAIHSKSKQLITIGASTGKLIATNLADYSEAWSESPQGSVYPTFTNLASANGLNIVCYSAGFIKGYDFMGGQQFTASSNQGIYFPLKIGASSKYLLNEQQSFTSNSKKLVLYFYPSGGAFQELNFMDSTVAIIPKGENDFYVFYNQGNTGKISIYSSAVNGLSFTYPSSLAGKIAAVAAIDETNFLVGTETGIYKFSYNPLNYVLYKAGIKASKIYYDVTKDEVILSENKKICFYDLGSGIAKNSIYSTDSILDFQLLYNR